MFGQMLGTEVSKVGLWTAGTRLYKHVCSDLLKLGQHTHGTELVLIGPWRQLLQKPGTLGLRGPAKHFLIACRRLSNILATALQSALLTQCIAGQYHCNSHIANLQSRGQFQQLWTGTWQEVGFRWCNLPLTALGLRISPGLGSSLLPDNVRKPASSHHGSLGSMVGMPAEFLHAQQPSHSTHKLRPGVEHDEETFLHKIHSCPHLFNSATAIMLPLVT